MKRKRVERLEIAKIKMKRRAARMYNLTRKKKIKSNHKSRSNNLNNLRNNSLIVSKSSSHKARKTAARHRELLLQNKNPMKMTQNRYFSFNFQEKCQMFIRHLKQCTMLLIKREKVLSNKKTQLKNLQIVLGLKMKRNKLRYLNS